MTIEAVNGAISGLPEEARAALAAWLNIQNMDAWDREMQGDFSPSGRGNHVVQKVKGQISSAMFRPFSEGRAQGHE